jgi:thiamine-phosphate diphosphorylase
VAAHAARITRAERARLLHGIYAILNDDARILDRAEAALGAGVRVLQYRAKRGIEAQRLRALRALTAQRDALLVINDDWRAAMQFDCDGVHLGPGDDGFLELAPVRNALPQRLIGLSCGTIAEVLAANDAGVDYVGAGSIYATQSKSDAGAPIGTAGLRTLVAASALPVAAIGGITAATIPQIRQSGAAMAAVISAISAAAEPQRAARALVAAWEAP